MPFRSGPHGEAARVAASGRHPPEGMRAATNERRNRSTGRRPTRRVPHRARRLSSDAAPLRHRRVRSTDRVARRSTIDRPSGEKAGWRCSHKPSPSRVSILACAGSLMRAIQMRRSPVGPGRANTIWLPSAETAASSASGTTSEAAPPKRSTFHSPVRPPRSDVNTRALASGSHAGSVSDAGSSVNRIALPPRASTIQMSGLPDSSDVYAMSPPSGETAGVDSQPGGHRHLPRSRRWEDGLSPPAEGAEGRHDQRARRRRCRGPAQHAQRTLAWTVDRRHARCRPRELEQQVLGALPAFGRVLGQAPGDQRGRARAGTAPGDWTAREDGRTGWPRSGGPGLPSKARRSVIIS